MPDAERQRYGSDSRSSLIRTFPGMLHHPGEAAGRVVRIVLVVDNAPALVVILFDDDTFLPMRGSAAPSTIDLAHAIHTVRPHLEARYGQAYRQLDAVMAEESDVARRARVANILGAIEANVPRLPELLDEIPKLLDRVGRPPSPNTED